MLFFLTVKCSPYLSIWRPDLLVFKASAQSAYWGSTRVPPHSPPYAPNPLPPHPTLTLALC